MKAGRKMSFLGLLKRELKMKGVRSKRVREHRKRYGVRTITRKTSSSIPINTRSRPINEEPEN
jgi:hypothetical protein